MLDYFPKYFSSNAIRLYFILMVAVSVLFIHKVLPLVWIIFGIVSVMTFFYYSSKYTLEWQTFTDAYFLKKLFQFSLIVRVVWVIFTFFFYQIMYDSYFDHAAADAIGYHNEARWLHQLIREGNIEGYFDYIHGRYSDMGYPFFLGLQYTLTGDSILIARLIKALLGAITVVLVYQLARRNFGEECGRIAGIFLMILPTSIFYTGLHLKEVEMVFLTMLFLERADYVIRNKSIRFFNLLLILVLLISLFLFRTVLGTAAVFALSTALLLTAKRQTKTANRWFVGIWVVIAIVFFMGSNMATEVEQIWEQRALNQVQALDWQAERETGNRFARYASAAVFAPAILVIPFPTMVHIEHQHNQMMMHGGFFIKNFLAFFVMLALYKLLINKKIRENLLIITFTLSYLMIIAFSAFANSERFHQPALPLQMILAAYGITQINSNEKRFFQWYVVLLSVSVIVWNWFKLAGRGLD